MAIEDAVSNNTRPGTSRAQLYTWQTWVHYGPGAENCEDVHEDLGTVECHNPLHFHAWVRLPNPHQWRDVREKALAAKARRVRVLRDESSDAHMLLEDEVEQLARRGEAAREEMVGQIMQPEWWKSYLEAERQIQFERVDPDDEESELRWAHIDDDREKLSSLRAAHADDQKQDEIRVIEERLAEYDKRRQELRIEAERPLRDELEALDISALVDRLRETKIAEEGAAFFEHTFTEWEWVTCTYYQVEGASVWQSPEDLATVPEGVIDQLRQAFVDLNKEKGGLRQGNS